jgi:WD40 repeat protein
MASSGSSVDEVELGVSLSTEQGTISIWNIKDGKLARQIEEAHGNSRGMNPSLSFVAATSDGRRIVSAGQTTVPIARTKLVYGPKNVMVTEIRRWDLETGERVEDLQGGEDYGRGYAALSRDGRRLAVGDFGMLRILDAATGRPERTIPLPGCWGDRPAFSTDGTLVAMAIHNTVAIFEVETGRRLHHDEPMPDGFLESAAWSPAGDRIVTGHGDGGVRVWDAETGKLAWHKTLAPPVGVHGRNARPTSVAFSRDGRHVVAAGRRDDPIRYNGGIVAVYDAELGLFLSEVDRETIRWGTLAPDGRMVVVGTSNGSWDDTHLVGVEVYTGQTRWTNPPEEQRAGFVQLAGMQFQPGSTSLGVAMKDGNVILLDALTGLERRRFLADGRTPEQQRAGRPANPGMFTAAFSIDGRTMVSSSGESVCVSDLEAGTLRRRIPYPNPHGCYLALSADSKTIATSEVNYVGDPGQDKIRLYDAETSDLVLVLEPGDDRSHVLEFSPDGRKLLAGFHRGTTIIWDVRRVTDSSKAKE